MFMNMNFEWIASFPGRDNYCGSLQFPGTVFNCYQTCLREHFFAEVFPQFSNFGY